MIGLLVDLGAAPGSATVVVGVPAQSPAPSPGKGEEFGKSSPVALVVILLLALATVALIVSMSKRIKRLPASFDPPDAGEGGPDRPAGGAGSGPA